MMGCLFWRVVGDIITVLVCGGGYVGAMWALFPLTGEQRCSGRWLLLVFSSDDIDVTVCPNDGSSDINLVVAILLLLKRERRTLLKRNQWPIDD